MVNFNPEVLEAFVLVGARVLGLESVSAILIEPRGLE
jgi:hypothetical protein